jgi:UDP-N-acetylglucosamine--dolichyl-phosphate N-acetylglucosaminephosphotransferase
MIELFTVLAVSFAFTYLGTPHLIPKLKVAKIMGQDMSKSGKPKVPEMGGLAIVGGFVVGVLLAIALTTFSLLEEPVNLAYILAGLSTILIMALIGIIDDLFIMRQRTKALLPVFAALPLVAVKAGVTTMTLPLLGPTDFGILYVLVLIPVAITGAANATNMLAGFNGLEAGLGLVMTGTVGVVSYLTGSVEATVLSFAMFGALLAFIRYNWCPAKILIGDIGTLCIGASIATIVILGNIEKVGIILIAPFVFELVLKARSRFEAESWCEFKNNLLVCPSKHEVYGLGRLVMYLSGGIRERNLVLTLITFELVFAVLAFISIVGLY